MLAAGFHLRKGIRGHQNARCYLIALIQALVCREGADMLSSASYRYLGIFCGGLPDRRHHPRRHARPTPAAHTCTACSARTLRAATSKPLRLAAADDASSPLLPLSPHAP